jgi:prepilin-type N-terminal cleavage/methylation domain-containing protein/prepilin-type processing-associated H-X9-DG protein
MGLCMHKRGRDRAFTLIEVLVVVAVIALLVAVLLPSLASARKSARASICMGNVRQLAVGYQVYSLSRRDRLMCYDMQVLYLKVLASELKNVDEVRSCPDGAANDPTQPLATARRTWTWPPPSWNSPAKKWFGSYALNGFFYDGRVPPYLGGWAWYFQGAAPASVYPDAWFKNLSAVKKPAATPVFGDAYWVDAWPFNGYTGPATVLEMTDVLMDTPYTRELARYVINRHSMKTNLSYADGHAARVLLKDLPHQQWSGVYKPGADNVRWP